MKEILPQLEAWVTDGEEIAVATVVQTWGSSPRAPGAKMAITASGKMVGSVSAGCVEGAVLEESRQVIKQGHPRLLHYGVTDDTAWSVGLTCGGTLEVFVEPLDQAAVAVLRNYIRQQKTVLMAQVIRGPADWLGAKAVIPDQGDALGDLLHLPVWQQVSRDAGAVLGQKNSVTREYQLAGPGESVAVEVFFDVYRLPPRLIVVGGVHIAMDLIRFAQLLGFTTYLVDPRTAFATPERFPQVDYILHQWPDEALLEIGLGAETCVVTVSHDPKLDDPALKVALPSMAGYVGALGSVRTNAKRRERLLAEGISQQHLDRLCAPIGLKLGGRTPAEIALSIIAQIVAVQNGVSAGK